MSGLRVEPRVSLSQGYTDNVGRASTRGGSMVTSVGLGLNASQNTSRLSFSLNYLGRTNYYWNAPTSGYNGTWNNQLSASGRAMLYDDFLFVDADARIVLLPTSVTAPVLAYDPTNFGVNPETLREFRTFSLSPFIRGKVFGNFANYELRYRALTSNQFSSFGPTVREEHKVSGVLSNGSEFNRLRWSWSGDQLLRTFRDGREQTRVNSTVNVSYPMPGYPELRFGASALFDRVEFLDVDGKDYGFGWGATIDWTPSSRTQVSMGAFDRYFGRTGYFRGVYRSGQSVFNVNFSKDILTSTNDGLLYYNPLDSTTIGTGSTLGYSNPLTNTQLVTALLGPQGIVTLLYGAPSDVYIYDTRLTAGLTVASRRTTIAASGFVSERTFSTSRPLTLVDPRLGVLTTTTQQATELRQRGLSLNVTHRVNNSETLSGYLLHSRTQFQTAVPTSIQMTTLGGTYGIRLNNKSVASITLRHTTGRNNGSDFSENAIIGTFDTRF